SSDDFRFEAGVSTPAGLRNYEIARLRDRSGCEHQRSIAPQAFLLFLFTYRGELSSFMQNSQVLSIKFCKHW
ncbi:hypothetical protein, partial [Microcoleus sp. F10B5]|uniref:hypothetical protein n=1 Tax=Microcoleus sp. F10B5 TaxID=3055341 RepID=UPI002FD735FC